MLLNASKPSKIRRYLSLWIIPLGVLAIGLIFTYSIFRSAQVDAEQNLRNYFDFRVREAISHIEQRVATYEQVLQGAQGLFEASESVDRNEFKQYVASLHLADNYPGIQGVGFSLMIPAAEKTNHLAKIRREGFPEYFIRPEGERDIYTSIIYLEPFADRNLRAFGYDMYSEPVRHEAMQKALETGNASLSGKVRLVQESGKNEQAGFLMYLPVYRNDRPHATVSARTENIIGWVYSPFRMDDFMAGAQGERAADLDIEIFDGESNSVETLLHDSDGSLTAQLPVASSYFTEQRLRVVDHTWTIRIHPLAPIETQFDSTKPLYFAGFGSLISTLMSVLIGLLLSGRDRAIRTAQMMSQQLIHERTNLNRIIEGTQAGTWEWNVQTGECVFNAQWAAIIGYELKELEPISIETWRKFAHPDDIKVSEDLLAKHFAGQLQYYQSESRMRHKDGHWVWIMDRGALATSV